MILKKINIKNNNKQVIKNELNLNNNEEKENIDKKNDDVKTFELFRINLLKYVFNKK